MPWRMDDSFYVAIVTPVLHYCMGGLDVSPHAEVNDKKGNPIPGLYAAGEVMGGTHGVNRLGGSSLLDCVVFGRVAGNSAVKHLLANLITNSGNNAKVSTSTTLSGTRRVATLAGHWPDAGIFTSIRHEGLVADVHVDPKNKKLSLQVSWDEKKGNSDPVVKIV